MFTLSFTTINFLIFLLICFLIYYICPVRYRWIVLLIGSMVFYASFGWEKLIFLLVTSGVVWVSGLLMNRLYEKADQEITAQELSGKEKMQFLNTYKKKCKRCFLIPAIVLVVGALCYCKFGARLFQFLYDNTLYWTWTDIIVPLGVSYYTFSSVGYLLDIYWRKQKHIPNYFQYLLCMSFFPQMVQGPIARYGKLHKQIQETHRFDFKNVCFGLQLMLYGYFKKLVIGDRIGIFTGSVLGNIGKYEGLVFPITLIMATFQLYMDFSGCMDIVRGTAQIFGIKLDKNFDHPFFSKSVAEFWRRWHITLGAWFKDYIYMPVAMSPKLMKLVGKVREKWGNKAAKNISTVIPLMIVWILTGLWHGTGWNYIVWGLYYGLIISCSTIFSEQYKKFAEKLHIDMTTKGYEIFQMIRTFCLFTVGRLITAPGTLEKTWLVIKQTFSTFNPWIFWDGTLYGMGIDYKDWCVAILGLIFVRQVSIWQQKGSVRESIASKNIVLRWIIYYGAIFAIIIFGIYGVGYNASDFVYANF